jgi:hypothetical protein
MAKKIGAGSEVDAWCTKCKMDLNHRVIAMEGDKIKRVECLTCRGHHNYRRPKSAEPEPKRRSTSKKKKRAAKKAAVPDYRKLWEEAIMGRSPDDFTKYTITGNFEVGDLVRHKKFGDGVVAEIIEGGKIQVIFEPGPKTLVYGR